MNKQFNSIEEVWNYLNAIPTFKDSGASASNFGLKAIFEFCGKIGNPQKNYPSIHVAGTNGKGTTCHIFEEVFTRAGYKTGMFTSPHLLSYNERFRIAGKECSDELILEFFNAFRQEIDKAGLTYFEISTALAFWIFDNQNVDIAIIETGLGGLLDSTNIIEPVLSVITSIGKDHQAILGDSIEEISYQKAGIIKNGTPVVTGNLDEASINVISEICQNKEAPLHTTFEMKPLIQSNSLTFSKPQKTFRTQLKEEVNAWNFAMVYKAITLLQSEFTVTDAAIKTAFEQFKGVPGRFEKIHDNYEWYFTGAHNEQAIDSVIKTIDQFEGQEAVLIFTLMKDKVSEKVLKKFARFEKRYFVELGTERAAQIQEINALIDVKPATEQSISKFLNELKSSLVIFAGSFYFYPTIKRWTDQMT